MKFILRSSELHIFQEKLKIYTQVSRSASKPETYLKITPQILEFVIKTPQGLIKTLFQISDTDFTESKYYQIDYLKWANALQKYGPDVDLALEIKKNALWFSAANKPGSISLALTTIGPQTSIAQTIDNLINTKKTLAVHKLELIPDILGKLSVANSMFVSQVNFNSIGINQTGVINSNNIVITKAQFNDPIDKAFFGTRDPNTYIYIHTFFLDLFPLLVRTNNEVWFSDNTYDIIYWADDNTSFIMRSEPWSLALPSSEEWNNIIPQAGHEIEININELKDMLNFFEGFYEAGDWKPLTFNLSANKSFELSYSHPTAVITQELPIIPEFDASFMIDAGILSRALQKVKDFLPDPDAFFTLEYAEDSPGILLSIGDSFQFFLAIISESK